MKSLTFTLIAIFCFLLSHAQPVYFSTSYARPQTKDPKGNENTWKDMKVDQNGNAYVLANLVADQDFDGTTYSVKTNRMARVLIKYDAGGQIVWAKSTGNTEGDIGAALMLDANDNPVVAGNIGKLDGVSALRYRFAITSYNKSDGSVAWEKIADGGTGTIKGAAMNANGEIYLAVDFASFEENIKWGQILDFYVTTGTPSIIIKTDASGDAEWVKLVYSDATTKLDGSVNGISAGGNGEMYLVGDNKGPFVSRIDAVGDLEWFVKTGDNKNDDHGYAVLYHEGDVYATGRVGNLPLDFGNGVSSADNFLQGFVVKLTANGEAVWMLRNQSIATDFEMVKLAPMPNGNIVAVANFRGKNVSFSGKTFSSSLIGPYPQIDEVIYEFDTTGVVINSYTTSGDGTKAQIVGAGPDNSVWFGGTYRGSIKIGGNSLAQIGGAIDFNFFITRVEPQDIATGIELPFKTESGVNIYPNPSNGSSISFSLVPDINTIVIISDISGKTISTSPAAKTITLPQLEQGLYFISSMHAGQKVTQRLAVN